MNILVDYFPLRYTAKFLLSHVPSISKKTAFIIFLHLSISKGTVTKQATVPLLIKTDYNLNYKIPRSDPTTATPNVAKINTTGLAFFFVKK